MGEPSKERMRVVVYGTQDANPPNGLRFMARIWCEFTTKGGKVKHDWHPVVVYGETYEQARLKAQGWWVDETTKAAQKAQNIANGVAKRRAAHPQESAS